MKFKKRSISQAITFFFVCTSVVVPYSYTFALDKTDNLSPCDSRFYCPPCGCDNDHNIFLAPGKCVDCGMQMIELSSGITGRTAELISGIFRENSLTIAYYDRVMYPAFFTGLLLSLVMLSRARQNPANLFLAILTISFALYPVQNRMMCLSHFLTGGAALVFFPLSFIVSTGPSIYLYTRGYTSPKNRISKSDVLHFLPTLAVVVAYLFFFFKSEAEKSVIYLSPQIISFANYEQIIAIIIALVYLAISFKLIRDKQSMASLSNKERQVLWLKRTLTVLTLFFVGWFGLLVVNKVFFEFGVSPLTYYPLWAGIALLLYSIGFCCIFRPNLIFANGVSKTNGYADYLTIKQIDEYSRKLIDLMSNKKLYLDSTLDLNKLSDRMQIKPKLLTTILNKGLQKNFYHFLNEYRIEEAKDRLQDPENKHLTILAIAYDSGFNSKSSFNSLFKKHVGMTPKQFQKNLGCPPK